MTGEQTRSLNKPAPPLDNTVYPNNTLYLNNTVYLNNTGHLKISTRPGPVVAISGEIDIQSSPQLRDQLLRVIRRHGAGLALDLAGVTFIDCAGIGVLLATRRRAQLEGGSLRVLRASPCVRRVIALTRLDPVLMPAALSDALVS